MAQLAVMQPTTEQTKEKPLTCPVPHPQRKSLMAVLKRMGWMGFFFFLIKGLLWLIVPYLVAKGFLK